MYDYRCRYNISKTIASIIPKFTFFMLFQTIRISVVCKCFAGNICVWHNTRMMIPNQTIPGLRGSAAWHTCSKIATGWFCLKPVSWDILGRSPSPTACVEAADLAQRELEEIDAAKLKAPEDQLWFLSLVSFQHFKTLKHVSSLRFYGHLKRCWIMSPPDE